MNLGDTEEYVSGRFFWTQSIRNSWNAWRSSHSSNSEH